MRGWSGPGFPVVSEAHPEGCAYLLVVQVGMRGWSGPGFPVGSEAYSEGCASGGGVVAVGIRRRVLQGPPPLPMGVRMLTTRNTDLELDGGVAAFPGWTLIEVSGRHRERFLATQATSDVAGLAVGESQLSALLDRTGRLQAFFFLCKRNDVIELLVPDEVAGRCVEKLEGHIIADDVAVTRRGVGSMRLALGPAAVVLADQGPDDEVFPVTGWGSRGFVTWTERKIPLPEISADELEARRVLGGPPRWGREIEPGQLINETLLLDLAVSFDKGCYLGQETVAKVASHRGAVRAPVVLETGDPEAPIEGVVGDWFSVGDRKKAGRVLSVADWDGIAWLQVSLHRELRVVGRKLAVVFADGTAVDATIHPAPMLPTPSRVEMADRLSVAASAAFAEGSNDRALELLERAIAVCPTSADAHESLGVILGRIGRLDEAIEEMHRLLEIDPSSVMAHSNLSLFYNRLGDIEAAERHLAVATRVSFGGSATADPAGPAAVAAKREADQKRREEMFDRVLAIDPDDALAHFGLGELALEQGRLDPAIDHLEKAIAIDPAHAAAILALGRALEDCGDTDRARDVYERGTEVAAKKGDLATAQKMQERLNALAPRAP